MPAIAGWCAGARERPYVRGVTRRDVVREATRRPRPETRDARRATRDARPRDARRATRDARPRDARRATRDASLWVSRLQTSLRKRSVAGASIVTSVDRPAPGVGYKTVHRWGGH